MRSDRDMDDLCFPTRLLLNDTNLKRCWLAGVYPERFRQLTRRDAVAKFNIAELW